MGQIKTVDSLDERAIRYFHRPHLYGTTWFLGYAVCIPVRDLQPLHDGLLHGTQPAVRLAVRDDDALLERA